MLSQKCYRCRVFASIFIWMNERRFLVLPPRCFAGVDGCRALWALGRFALRCMLFLDFVSPAAPRKLASEYGYHIFLCL